MGKEKYIKPDFEKIDEDYSTKIFVDYDIGPLSQTYCAGPSR